MITTSERSSELLNLVNDVVNDVLQDELPNSSLIKLEINRLVDDDGAVEGEFSIVSDRGTIKIKAFGRYLFTNDRFDWGSESHFTEEHESDALEDFEVKVISTEISNEH